MEERFYNLCEESWICVMLPDYQEKKVSLTDALLNSHDYLRLAGETESQNIAILRLLLAVLHTVFYRQNEDGKYEVIDTPNEARRRWKAIWKNGSLPQAPVIEYLDLWKDRFWLFDEKHPFYQVPDIIGSYYPAKKMNGALVESNNKIQLFSMSNGKVKNQLQYDEAARWLIYLQSFDDTAAKKPSPSMCHVSTLGLVVARGKNLFETLMLNLTLLKDGTEVWGEAKPAWERKTPDNTAKHLIPLPDNQPEILTMQCRRLLLHREKNVVTNYIDVAGDYIEKEGAFSEQMTFWQKKEIKKGLSGYFPKSNNKTRQMWRDFSVLLGNNGRMPGIVSWVTMLQSKRILPKDQFITFQILGVEYGSLMCGIVDEFSDAIEFPAEILNDLNKVWQQVILDEIGRCEKLVQIVSYLAKNVNMAAGGDGTNSERVAQEMGYYRLDIPFRHWLFNIDPDFTVDERNGYRKKWRESSLNIIRDLGQELVDQAGISAFVGKTVIIDKKKQTKIRFSAPEAFNRFLAELYKYV